MDFAKVLKYFFFGIIITPCKFSLKEKDGRCPKPLSSRVGVTFWTGPKSLFFCELLQSKGKRRAKMPLQKLMDFLEENNVKFTRIIHSTAYTAQVIAHRSHISGNMLTVAVNSLSKEAGSVKQPAIPACRR